ncbi:MAG TPA: LuxR C-terminal-related transcriptional regulator, partial [Symbiobacteriaceae bacterium]|nr:LuxR C-terminal-related transcriptional regulator [Symbiobacteriaceae bacterium]
AEWHRAEGQFTEAVDHLLDAGDFDRAADWMEEAAPERRWLDRLPPEVFETRPRLATMAAWLLIAGGEVQADAAYKRAAAYLDLAGRAGLSGEAAGILAAVRTALAPWAPVRQCPMCTMQDLAHAVACGDEARQLLPAESHFWRSVVSSSLGAAFLRAGDLVEAAVAFGEAARLGARSTNLTAAVDALSRQGQLLLALGRLREAEAVFRAGEGASALLGLGQVQFQRGDLDGALVSLSEAVRLAESPDALLALARVRQARGEGAAARALVDRAGELLGARERLRAAGPAAWPEGVRILLEQGDVAAARRWVDSAGVEPERAPELWRAGEYLALARVLLAEGDATGALPLAGAVRELAAAAGWVRLADEARVVEAAAARTPASVLPEPLTEREQEILQLLAAGCSNQAIAERLFMGVSTVKWHLINIYGKLQVGSRTQAVARARAVGLL